MSLGRHCGNHDVCQMSKPCFVNARSREGDTPHVHMLVSGLCTADGSAEVSLRWSNCRSWAVACARKIRPCTGGTAVLPSCQCSGQNRAPPSPPHTSHLPQQSWFSAGHSRLWGWAWRRPWPRVFSFKRGARLAGAAWAVQLCLWPYCWPQCCWHRRWPARGVLSARRRHAHQRAGTAAALARQTGCSAAGLARSAASSPERMVSAGGQGGWWLGAAAPVPAPPHGASLLFTAAHSRQPHCHLVSPACRVYVCVWLRR